jgi:formiminotetrahydrofolate cyclodeaminase
MADDMEDGEHEQLACPSCNHSADYVRGGQLCNGICSECGGSGTRDPEDEAHLYEGYTDKEGNKIDGKNHHYTHNGAVDAKFDFLNSLMMQSAQASIDGHKMPAGMLAPSRPLWQMYGDATNSGQFRTLEELREARKKKELPKLVIDEDAPEFQNVPSENVDPARTEEVRQKRIAEKLLEEPKSPFNFVSEEVKLPTVHNTAVKNHNQLMLSNHIDKLAQMAEAGQGDAPQFQTKIGMTPDGEKTYEQVPIDVKQQIKDLVNKIKTHPAFLNGDVHGNTEHHLLEQIHNLQEIAEAPFVDDLSDVEAGKTMKRKDRNKLIAQRRRLPVDEKGNISLTAADVFGGNSPMTFGDFQSLYPAHGRMLTMKEIREGVFEPGATHAPSDITDKDLKRLFAGNRKAQGVIKRRERTNEYTPEAMQSVTDVFNKIKTPMTRRKTTNLTSSALNDLLRNYGEKEMVGEMEDHHLTYSDETMKAIADSDITKSKVNNLLTSANAEGIQRPLNSRYTMGLNGAIREMWQKYSILNAMNVFMREINNPLEFPKIPQNINQNNFQDLTREDSALYELMHDEAAKLLGYDDYEHFEKKFNLKKTAQITGGRGNVVQEIKPLEFKDSVMANAKHSDEGEFPIGYEKLKRDEDGEIESKFVPSMTSSILERARNSLITPADQQMYDVMKKVGNYHECPSWHHRNTINNIVKGEEGKGDGFDNYEELRQAHANNALPPELAKEITTSFMLSYLSHPTLSLQNHGDMLKYEHATNEGVAATPAVQPAQPAPPVQQPAPRQPLQFFQYGVGPRTIGGDENSQ